MEVADRVAIVTGGGRGIGRGIARRLSAAGAAVAVADRDSAAAEAVAAELIAAGGRALAVEADVTDPGSIERLTKRVLAQLGRLDILVNNAGLTGATVAPRPFLDTESDTWRRVLEVNLTGPFLCSLACARPMAQRRWGRIIHIGSINSLASEPGCDPYAASKAGLIGLTKAMAVDLAPHGILVNCLAPGPVLTERNRAILTSPAAQPYMRRIALGRPGDPDEIGAAAVFLASDASSFMTGQTLVVDGGYLATM